MYLGIRLNFHEDLIKFLPLLYKIYYYIITDQI